MKKMQRLILIRHGESEGNVDPKIYMTKKDHDVELTEKGRSHSKECGLDLNKILSMTQNLYFDKINQQNDEIE